MSNERDTLGKVLYLAVDKVHGGLPDAYEELSEAEKIAWEAEALRLVIRDIPERDLVKGISEVALD